MHNTEHYRKQGHKECIDEMIDNFGLYNTIIFCRINAYKYKYRIGLKANNDTKTELEKIAWYENKEKELLKRYFEHEKN